MSRPLPVLGAGLALSLLLGAVLLAGLLTERWALVALSGWALGSAVLLVQLDTWRRTRSLRRYVRDQVREVTPVVTVAPGSDVPVTAPTASPDDVVGTVRFLQAQYVGRLDRMQTALDEAIATLRDRGDATS